MRNVLPLESKRNIKQEYRVRLGIVVLLLVVVLSIIGIVSLLPSLFLSEAQSTAAKERAELVLDSISLRQQDVSTQELNEATAKLAVLAKENNGLGVRDAITLIVDNKENGIALSGFFFTESGSGERLLTIKGNADRRDDLLAFQKRLLDERTFSDVRLPVSSLAKNRDVDFILEIVGDL